MNKFEELYTIGSYLRSLDKSFDTYDIKAGLWRLVNFKHISFNNLVNDLDFLCNYTAINHRYNTGFNSFESLHEVAVALECYMDEYYEVQKLLEDFHITFFDGYVAELYPYDPNEYDSKKEYVENIRNNGVYDYVEQIYDNFKKLSESKHHLWYADEKLYALSHLVDEEFIENIEKEYEAKLPYYYLYDGPDETSYSNLKEIFKMFISETEYINDSADCQLFTFKHIDFPKYNEITAQELKEEIICFFNNQKKKDGE